jgi:hypothetical protein
VPARAFAFWRENTRHRERDEAAQFVCDRAPALAFSFPALALLQSRNGDRYHRSKLEERGKEHAQSGFEFEIRRTRCGSV